MSTLGARSESGAATAAPLPSLTLIGTGTVGAAFVSRWQRLAERGLALPRLALLANSRGAFACNGDPGHALRQAGDAAEAGRDPQTVRDAHLLRGDVVVDATASEAVAARHAEWVAHGVHVVTANKLGNGADLLRAQAIVRAARAGAARYGDAATVGAGLPLLRSIRELVAGGDRIHAVEGVLSGSLAWLFDRYDGDRPFSALVREARDAGYTEPDPRQDLSGEDVRRKLLILARAAGFALEGHEVRVDSLVPALLAQAAADGVDANLQALDDPLQRRLLEARRAGAKLRFVGRFDADGAEVGLQALPADHPLCAGSGTDNRVAIRSDRYREQPLVIQGPGAGAEVTAAALIDDVLRILS
ncbi:homoserine dehydrogenase [Luteimonas aquatica]|uniref:homoserine dehydrogenase n=1 Tax=Luteimonas aquatica TaxID=450364 RepID=UPI001F59942F|nr:homoserine dehydrogenase [Luteimonas aquatica]